MLLNVKLHLLRCMTAIKKLRKSKERFTTEISKRNSNKQIQLIY